MSSAGTTERDRESGENSNGTKNKKQKKNISQSNVLREMSEENEWNVVEGAEKC